MMKAFKWIVGVVFALGILTLIIGGGSQNPPAQAVAPAGQAQASAPPSAPAKASEQTKPVHKTTAPQLARDYHDNEVAADEKMKGKIIEVSGTVQSIDKSFTDSIVIALRTGNEFMAAHMNMDDSEKDKAMTLKRGAKVVIRCERMARTMGSPYGSDCTFQN